jgi:hypothetical protein
MSKSDHDTCKQASHTIPATSIASVSVTVPRFVRIIRISSLARHLLSADFSLEITRGVRLRVGSKGLSLLGVSRAGVRFCTGAVAEALRDNVVGSTAAEPELLAHHFTQARLIEAAIEWWGKAGQWSLARSALADATAKFSRAAPHLVLGREPYTIAPHDDGFAVTGPADINSVRRNAIEVCERTLDGSKVDICRVHFQFDSKERLGAFVPCRASRNRR